MRPSVIADARAAFERLVKRSIEAARAQAAASFKRNFDARFANGEALSAEAR